MAAVGVLLLILVPVFFVMTRDRIERQDQFVTQKLFEKGISLIRTFEAGTRTGMLNMRWGAQRIQLLLTETALQPDVVYMMITTKDGLILSHSNPDLVGQINKKMPQVPGVNDDPVSVYHRVLRYDPGKGVFEVFKRFEPVRSRMGHRPGRMHRMRMMMQEHRPGSDDHNEKDWSLPYQAFDQSDPGKGAEHYMIAGLSMAAAKVVRDKRVKETVFQAGVYFLLIFSGMAAVFIFQAYRAAKSSLSSMKAYSDTVIQNMPAGLVTTDINGSVTAINDAAKKILDDNIASVQSHLNRIIATITEETPIVSQELLIETAGDKSILLDLTASGIRDAENRDVGYLFLFKDLTREKDLKQQVETHKRLAAIGKLAAGVAHEIRNPLSSIKGLATYFGQRYEDNLADKETAQIMVTEVERINRSITQLLEFAKPMPTQRSAVDLKQIIDHSIKLVAPDLDAKNITARVNIDLAKTDIYSDGDRLNQVLLNLYMNGLQALEKGGRLDINVTQAGDGMIEIEICDSGEGMEQDVLARIFEPYFTTHATGTGLGLSIVHRIMENLGGSIRAKSKKGEGTCFTLVLPVGEDNA